MLSYLSALFINQNAHAILDNNWKQEVKLFVGRTSPIDIRNTPYEKAGYER